MVRKSFTISHLATLVLCALTIALYWPSHLHEFILYDDTGYVIDNTIVQQGLTAEGFAWALFTGEMSNWHPITWMSHMLDCELFGLNAGAHHIVNAVLHGVNAMILWLVLFGLTSAWWRSGLVAALFALHPLHVESVAWVSERKDLLSALFAFLALDAYRRYAAEESIGRYILVAAFMALSLMCKPMMVTLPAVLLLLDYWPLRRCETGRAQDRSFQRVGFLVIEKMPLVALSIASAIITIIVQLKGGAVSTLTQVPLADRLANAAIAYVWYAQKAVWPSNLCVLYPFPAHVNMTQAAAATAIIAAALVIVWLLRRRAPFALVGLLWFLGTLVPVIGVVQVGSQAMADRYTYVPLIGLFIIIAWLWPPLAHLPRRAAIAVHATVAAILLTALSVATRDQLGYWKDSHTLFSRALHVDPTNHLAHLQVGHAIEESGEIDRALIHYRSAVEFRPDSVTAWVHLGNALVSLGRFNQAIESYQAALRANPQSGEAQHNLANAYLSLNDAQRAVPEFIKAAELMPKSFDVRYNFGKALFEVGRFAEAAEQFRLATSIDPQSAAAHNNLGSAIAAGGNFSEAVGHFERAAELDPAFPGVQFNLASALEASGNFADAAVRYRMAIEQAPDDALAHARLARLEHRAGRIDLALTHYREALRHDPHATDIAAVIQQLEKELVESVPSSSMIPPD